MPCKRTQQAARQNEAFRVAGREDWDEPVPRIVLPTPASSNNVADGHSGEYLSVYIASDLTTITKANGRGDDRDVDTSDHLADAEHQEPCELMLHVSILHF